MKNKILLIIVLLLATINSVFAQKYVEYYFRVPFESIKKVNHINEICSVDKFDDHYVYGYANPKQFTQVTFAYPDYELLTNPSREMPIPVARSKEEMREWDSYPSYSTYVSMMQDFAIDYPNLCSVESIGTSVDNREILVAKLSVNPNIDEAEPKFFYSGQMHGDEIVCSILFLRLIDYLLENYGVDPEITQLLNTTQIYINPLSNPDGLYTSNDETINGATRYNANGVDLNRNYPGVNGDPNPDDNPVQVENIAMMNFAQDHRFTMSANSHSGAVVVNYPWDTWPRLHPDDNWYQHVSRIYADTVQENAPSPYMTDFDDGITNGFAWYIAIGTRQDWFNYFRNCREITLELSFNKTVPASQLNAHWDYNYEAMIEWLKHVHYGINGTITDASGSPLQAKIEILDHEQDNSFIYSSPLHGDYYRPIFAGEYSIKVSAEGYETQIIDNIVVENNVGTEVNLVLNQALITSIEGYVFDSNSNPLNNASITLSGTSIHEATSNNTGYFEINNVFSGHYTVAVSALGYQTQIQNIVLSAENDPFNFYLNESTAISFETELTPEWIATTSSEWNRSNDQAYDGIYSLKSGSIGNNSSSGVQVELNNESSVISFYYKVSSEEDYDFLHFYINDNLIDSWSGEVDWTYAEYQVNSGSNTFKWVYEKDGYVQNGSDCAWIDYVQLPTPTSNEFNENVNQHIEILDCYPNPFNPEVNIRFYQSLSNPITKISIYNLKGQIVSELNNLSNENGYQTVVWNGKNSANQDVSSGIYFVLVDNGLIQKTKKIVLMK
ncbi:carboxypeptidase regulatory-like domain-containing protein [bacterium]|nr:carboxypeptidase regulatory-like domain-containing protein [bacterium]